MTIKTITGDFRFDQNLVAAQAADFRAAQPIQCRSSGQELASLIGGASTKGAQVRLTWLVIALMLAGILEWSRHALSSYQLQEEMG